MYGFPLVLATILGIAFSSSQPAPPVVDVVGQVGDKEAEAIVAELTKAKVGANLMPAEKTLRRFNKGTSDLIIVPQKRPLEYQFDPAREKSVLARYWVETILARATHVPRGADSPGTGPATVTETILSEPGSRYIDFLLPGLIGINIMGGGLFGVGFVLVDMRVRKLFKRLLATPMHRGDFLLSLLTARMLFLLPEMLSLLLVGKFAFGVPLQGDLLTLLLVIWLGAFAFAGIGLLLACRTEKTESISGLINLVMLPMYLLSGVFFSADRFPDAAQPLIRALPLTQLNEALRAVMLEGAGLFDIAGHLAILAAWALITFTLALRWFQWK